LRTTAAQATVVVADAPLHARGRQLRARGLGFWGVVATLVDRNSFGRAGDLRATIDWGDGHRSPATFGVSSTGVDSLIGHHRYEKRGRYPVVVRIHDVGGSRVTARSTMVVPGH
jgi:hypothetical protein